MSEQSLVNDEELAGLAKKFRLAAGKTRSEAARDLKVSHVSIIRAEDHPEESLYKLRKRMIELYSGFYVSGPKYLLEKADNK